MGGKLAAMPGSKSVDVSTRYSWWPVRNSVPQGVTVGLVQFNAFINAFWMKDWTVRLECLGVTLNVLEGRAAL